MSYSDRIDVIDMIIGVLKEHEGSLDELVARLESLNKELGESSIADPLQRDDGYDASMELLDYKIAELEKKIETYRVILKAILEHCDKIQDIACVKMIADKTLGQ
jgi:hypothetical protein